MDQYARYMKLRLLLKRSLLREMIEINSYDFIIRKLNKKVFVLGVKDFLNYLFKNYHNFTLVKNPIEFDVKKTKKFILFLLISKFSNYILSNKIDHNHKLLKLSKQMRINVSKIIETKKLVYFLKLIETSNRYMTIYNLWEMVDKRFNTYKFLKSFYKNSKEIDRMNKMDAPNDIVLTNIQRNQMDIENCIKYMNDKNEKIFFDTYKNNHDYEPTIDKNIFLIECKYRIASDPPDKYVFCDLLNTVNLLLKQCVPNKQDIHKVLDEKLDCHLLKQYIDSGNDTMEHYSNLFYVILEYVKLFQSKSADDKLKQLQIKIENGFYLNNEKNKLIIIFFFEIINNINIIIKQREDFFKFIEKK